MRIDLYIKRIVPQIYTIAGYLDELKRRKGQKYLEDSIFYRIFAADKYKLMAL
jgi:hypothetical protein